MKVVVTGGAGFIGSHIVDALLRQGHSPFVIDNLSSGSRNNIPSDVPLYEVDICDHAKLSSAFNDIRPQSICHHAAQISVSRSMRDPIADATVNVMGTLNVFEHASRVGVEKILLASSGGGLYGDVTTPADEDFPKRPFSAYGISKSVGEQYLEFYARERGFQGVALRYSNVYGPRQNPYGEAGVVAVFSKMMLSGQPVTINGDGCYVRDYVYGADVAQANLLALETNFKSHFTAINIGTGIGVDVNELAAQISLEAQSYLQQVGSPLQIAEFVHGEPRAGDIRSNLISPSAAGRLIGWTPKTNLSAGLRESVRWFGEYFAS